MRTKALIGLLFLGVVAGACDSSRTEASSTRACGAGEDCLPDVKYVDTMGKAYTPEQLAGKVVVVNFWATWCGPCQKEIPDLSKLYEKYKAQGVVMLGVLTNDDPSDNDLLNFQSDHAMTYPVVRFSSDVFISFHRPSALPTTFVFDRGGHQIGGAHVGAISATELERTLGKLVAQK